jgi:hypothetical protein
MNKRIKHLMGKTLDSKFSHTWTTLTYQDLEKFSEKFAELIVRECLNIVSNQTTLDTNEDFREGFSHGLKYAWTDIKKHFGVEE